MRIRVILRVGASPGAQGKIARDRQSNMEVSMDASTGNGLPTGTSHLIKFYFVVKGLIQFYTYIFFAQSSIFDVKIVLNSYAHSIKIVDKTSCSKIEQIV